MTALTMDDVKQLKTDPSPAVRAGTAAKLAQHFNAIPFAPAELALAEQIFRIMVRDAEVRVREALSANLRANPRQSAAAARCRRLFGPRCWFRGDANYFNPVARRRAPIGGPCPIRVQYAVR
jgi:hypothetical protein